MIALDLFAGHGWGVACQKLGIEEYGVEIMPEAIATRELNGMTTIYRDVWEGLTEDRPLEERHPVTYGDYELLIASPPCQTFSMAGGGAGRKALDDVLGLIDAKAYRSVEDLRTFGESHDPRTALVLTPLAHVYRDLPRYVVFEQVPPVLPVWERCAEEMRAWGYSVWTGNLQAEMYGTVVTCPLHSATAAADADRAFALDPATLAIADPAGTALGAWLEGAEIAAARETFIRKRASVESARRSKPGMTEGAVSERAAWNAALVSRAVLEDARDATWRELVKPLLSRALAETRTLPGRAGDMSMSAATSGFESTALIAGSIESLPSRLWAALCDLAKSYITSTSRPTTTTPETSPSFAATPTIGNTIESVIGRASCGACNDHAVPQTRKRAILIAKRDPDLDGEAAPPVPTHSRYYSRDPKRLDPGVLPWVSMAEALGWVEGEALRSNQTVAGVGRAMRDAAEPSLTMTQTARSMQRIMRPAPTVTGGGAATGGAEVFGRHGRAIIENGRATRVTVAEAAALQSYPPGFTFAGTKTKQFLQVGNAVPPLLAEAILRAVIS